MVNIKRLLELNRWYDSNPNYPFALEKLIPDVLDCMGENESEIIEFIHSATHEQLEFLSMFIEEIQIKFNSQEMSSAIDIIVNEMLSERHKELFEQIKQEILRLNECFKLEKKNDAPHPVVNELWDTIPEKMSELSEQELIMLLSNCSQDEIEALSPVFDLILENHNTNSFKSFLLSFKDTFNSSLINENIDIALN